MPERGHTPAHESSYSPQEDDVLAVLTSLVHDSGRPVWAREVRRKLFTQLGHGGSDGRWVAVALKRLAQQGRAVQIRRWRTDTSRWTLPDPGPASAEAAEPATGREPPTLA